LGNQLRAELDRLWPGPVGRFSAIDSRSGGCSQRSPTRSRRIPTARSSAASSAQESRSSAPRPCSQRSVTAAAATRTATRSLPTAVTHPSRSSPGNAATRSSDGRAANASATRSPPWRTTPADGTPGPLTATPTPESAVTTIASHFAPSAARGHGSCGAAGRAGPHTTQSGTPGCNGTTRSPSRPPQAVAQTSLPVTGWPPARPSRQGPDGPKKALDRSCIPSRLDTGRLTTWDGASPRAFFGDRVRPARRYRTSLCPETRASARFRPSVAPMPSRSVMGRGTHCQVLLPDVCRRRDDVALASVARSADDLRTNTRAPVRPMR